MPHIAINFYPGRDEETKTVIAKRLKEFGESELGFSAGSVSVSVVEIPKESFAEEIRMQYKVSDLYETSEYIN